LKLNAEKPQLAAHDEWIANEKLLVAELRGPDYLPVALVQAYEQRVVAVEHPHIDVLARNERSHFDQGEMLRTLHRTGRRFRLPNALTVAQAIGCHLKAIRHIHHVPFLDDRQLAVGPGDAELVRTPPDFFVWFVARRAVEPAAQRGGECCRRW